MNIQEILKFLPHRYPFLLVDRVISMDLDQSIVALKNITFNEHYFQGHFPEKAVMPGVLIIEALAQAAGILAYKSMNWSPNDSLFYLGAISNVKFKRIVVPGDQLTLTVKTLKRRSNVWKFSCEAFVGDEPACLAEITCMEGPVQ
jgi:beta-hydroxyacyl-[acyl carrier protein] dehydratase FabZ